ncbi:S-adenosylmethionine decarboxylase [Niveomyces insectorum RCEF 264]|uniref:S-adenosylmethionine decarboxylase n=1 Tax=Niveomyces insectorum RCEF 264 TaxID=1081102 RepID=A0A162MFM9_9HYPO|nr:S-adenosylmethionine decarboxylase [Niveomyces insectorum RCEF 264]
MGALDIPHGCTLSPSMATPHLFINHDVAADLDSSNAFEGPEKLLEVWFAPSPVALPSAAERRGLKCVPADVWVDMLDLVNCKILSVIRSDTVDAYLLSESSMFVFPHKIILKTCGTTTLLLGLHRMLRIAASVAGFPFHNAESLDDVRAAASPYRVFYSRKNFLFPDKQQSPHRSWKQEVKYLDDMFEGGSAYMVGKMNGDHWYLYITSPSSKFVHACDVDDQKRTGRSAKIPTGLPSIPTFEVNSVNDETLEILMTDLDTEKAKQFYLSHASAVARDKVLARSDNVNGAARNGAIQDNVSRLSDSSYSVLSSEELFDVDDVVHNSGGLSTPMSEGMDQEALTTEGHTLGTAVSENCGLSNVYPTSIYPDARIDAYMFAPCGFSANGVIPAPLSAPEPTNASTSITVPDEGNMVHGVHYFTVHVTPEPNCSFASFETNVPGGQKGRQTADIVKHVVDIFRPGRFSVTIFETKGSSKDSFNVANGNHVNPDLKSRLERVSGYRRIDRIVHDFEDYDLIFRYYEREGWVGDGEARLGEA